MKIAVWHNLPSGGGLRAMDDQVRGLAERGHDVHVWSPPSAAPGEWVDRVRSRHVVPLNLVDVQRAGAGRRLRSAWRGRRDDLDAFDDHSATCAREISDIEPDVLFAHSCQYFRVPAIARHLGVPSVLYLHEPNRRLFEATSGFPWVAPPPGRRLTPNRVRAFVGTALDVELSRIQVRDETRSVNAFDRVLVNSQFSRESVLRAYARDSRVCRLGIDTDRFAFVDRVPAGGIVLTVGAVVAEKNPDFVVRAVAGAGSAVKQLVWVANYVDERCRAALESVARETGVRLDLRMAVSEQELLETYAGADVFVYAPRLEPFGLAPLEAGATGLPVVAVAEAGVRETVVNGVNGLVVDHDIDAFGTALRHLLSDAQRVRTLGRSARAHVERVWGWRDAIGRLEHELSVAADPSVGLAPVRLAASGEDA